MDIFLKYLIAVNILSFLISSISIAVTKKRGMERLPRFRCFLSFIGGALGNLLAFLLFDRRADKENMTVNVVSVSTFIIYGVIVFALYGPYRVNKASFLANLSNVELWFWIYLSVMNLMSFIMFGVDKWRAIKGKSRISIVALLTVSFLGGSLGGIIAMYLFRHKTQKSYFKLGMPLIMLAQIVLFVYLTALGIL